MRHFVLAQKPSFQYRPMEKCSYHSRFGAAFPFASCSRGRVLHLRLPAQRLRDRSRRPRSWCACASSSLKEDIRVLRHELNNAVHQEDYFRAASLRDEILGLEQKDPVLSIRKQLAHAVEVEDYKVLYPLCYSIPIF